MIVILWEGWGTAVINEKSSKSGEIWYWGVQESFHEKWHIIIIFQNSEFADTTYHFILGKVCLFIYIVHDKSLHCCSSDLFTYFLSSFFRRFLESRTCKTQTWWFNNWYILLTQSVTNLKRFWVVHVKFNGPFFVWFYLFFCWSVEGVFFVVRAFCLFSWFFLVFVW